ncbi:2482_t:CDS:10 [Funneliformis geosporum]|uniref:Protein BFR2 n=1 Tax=Funneliformis geosporum TaxID=1117311 RepID=A0A9W4WUU8_9GLOM|nr:2482_t:CDS:10 [Funneliformis geosporum]
MASGKEKNTLAAQIAELSNPAPTDIDPEEFGETFRTHGFDQSDDDGENEKVEKDMGREHYISVGKSKLRHNLLILDDPKYAGKQSNRKDIFYDSNDIPDSEDIEMKYGQSSEYDTENEMTVFDEEDKLNSDKMKNDKDQESDFEKKDDDVSLENSSLVQEELKKIEEDERNLLLKMTQNVQEDINKGRHVKTQLGLWDTFLDTRIRLQKVVSIANSLPQNDVYSEFLSQESDIAVQETREELRELVDSLIDLRKDLNHENDNIEEIPDNAMNSRKRHLDDDNYTGYLWKDMKELRDQYLPYRKQTIDKWSNKVQIASGIPLNKKFKAINQDVNTQIEQILQDKERLINRTQLKRNLDNILGKKDYDGPNKDIKKHDEHLSHYDVEIFDDTDFYQQLLRELIESRMIDTDDPVALGMQWAAIRQTKQKKKKVDTKASKGRRLRYHVHEKLQNFMVPIPSSTWHEDMIDELYASLLGKKYEGGSELSENEIRSETEQRGDNSTIETSLNDLRIIG